MIEEKPRDRSGEQNSASGSKMEPYWSVRDGQVPAVETLKPPV